MFLGSLGRRVTLLCAVILGLVAAPARADDPGSTETFTYGAYPYIVYVPTTYDATHPAPLLVMTHGCQTTAEQQMRANLYNDVAEREGFIVLYPDVNDVEVNQPGPLKRCWQFPLPTNWHRGSADPEAIAGMTQAVIDHWKVDTERVYMVGMSAGSFMTSIMAAAYPELYAAVAINAGGAYADGLCLAGNPASLPAATSAQMAFEESGERARVIPRLVSGGDADAGITPGCADKALEQGLRTDNLVISGEQEGPISLTPASVREEPNPDGYASTVSTYLDPDGCVIGERWLIHGMNHFWPGGTTDPEYASFTDPKGPNGAELTWGFLKRYTKSETSLPCAEPLQAPEPCAARRLRLRVPAGAKRIRVRVNGTRVTARRVHRRVRLKLPAGRITPTRVVVRGRTSAGKRFTRRRTVEDC